MARGRIIDKELLSHESLAELDIKTRFFYIGLIVNADDEGRLKGSPKYLKGKIFPYDEVTEVEVEKMVNQLATIGCLVVYQVETNTYLAHPNWSKWQPIRKDRGKPSDCPKPTESNSVSTMATTCQPSVNQTPDSLRPNLTQPNLTEPNQTEPNQTQPNLIQPKKDTGQKLKKKFTKPALQEVAEYAKSIGFNLDGQKFYDYYESKGWMIGRNHMKDWKACVRTWKGNNYGGSNGNRQGHFDVAKSGKYPD